MRTPNFNVRLTVICFAAASVGLSIALISIAKLLLFATAIFSLISFGRSQIGRPVLTQSYVPAIILVILATLCASLLWTNGPLDEGLNSLGKYGKLLSIVALMALIQNRQDAAYALVAFLLAQTTLLLGSWALYVGIPVPWATSNMALTHYSVFSAYLDQSIMSSVTAAVFWHLRGLAPTKFLRGLAIVIAALAMVNVLFVLIGRTGHVVAIALLSLAIMWELPKKMRLAVVVLPFILVAVLSVSSTKVKERLSSVVTEVQSFSTGEQLDTSSGIRLSLWRRAVQMIAMEPVKGFGVGNWNHQYDTRQREKNPAHVNVTTKANTHQEYLQWGVQLGLPGILLFVGLMACILRDSLKMEPEFARATQSVLVAFAVTCLFNSALYDAHIGDFFCVAFGLMLALGLQVSGFKSPQTTTTGSRAGVLA